MAVLALGGCGEASGWSLPFDQVGLGLYSQPLTPIEEDRHRLGYPAEDTQYLEAFALPDQGIYLFLVEGWLTLSVADEPEVGSVLTMHELELTVRSDEFMPGRWMKGAKVTSRDWTAECTELLDGGSSRWQWTTVGDLTVETSDGSARSTYAWMPEGRSNSMHARDGERTLFVSVGDFARQGGQP